MAPASDKDLSTSETVTVSPAWWKEASVYQIYPASFFDSNGDGIGDIAGITSKLDYISGLGVDVIWLSPVYKSPQVDMGYDISDYRDIHPPYGTMTDVETLIQQTHNRGMKFVMDLVVNHTSDQHEWFQRSRSSKSSPYRDWYIWKSPCPSSSHSAPNNWKSMFGGSTWTFDPLTSEFYLHSFASAQPDLNWENPSVVQAVHEIMHFWLKKGVDGFRMDVINFISKVPGYPDAPITEIGSALQDASLYFVNGPRLHEHLKGLGRVLKEYNAFSVGEMPFAKDRTEVLKCVKQGAGELNMIFQFDIVDIDIGRGGKFKPHQWNLKNLKSCVKEWQTFMYENAGWNAIFSENHDQSRTVSRFTSDLPQHRCYAAKMLATWLGFQSGTIYIYQGQELGMKNMPADWGIEEYKDIETQNFWAELISGSSVDLVGMEEARCQIQLKARDNARTPMQWTPNANGGFTTASKPWMRVNDDFETCNALLQVADANSVYNHWASVLQLRKRYKKVFVYGSFELVDPGNETLFVYERAYNGSCALILLNWSSIEYQWEVDSKRKVLFHKGRIIQSNYGRSKVVLKDELLLVLQPWEALVLFHEA